MSRVTPADFFADRLSVGTIGRGHGFLRGMAQQGDSRIGYWWEGEYVHPDGIVSVYRQDDRTRLDFVRNGVMHMRTWEKYFGDRTIGQMARAFVADVIARGTHDQ